MKKLMLLVLLTSAMLYAESTYFDQWEINLRDINLHRYVIKVDGQKKEFYSFESDVERILDKEKVTLGDRDYLSIQHEENSYLIKVVRRQEKLITEVVEIPFTVVYRDSMDVKKGTTLTSEKGEPGLKEVTYRVIMEDGQEMYREPYSEEVIKNPKPEVILNGQRSQVKIASREPAGVSRTLVMEASAYTHTGNRTAVGVYPEYGTIAVDPKVIPLGTRLWVEGYGYGIAADTGSAIKGNKIDVFMDSRRECLHWGRRKVKVHILP
jgi:3D (Asp-Asp-Asp) domain-containing protein